MLSLFYVLVVLLFVVSLWSGDSNSPAVPNTHFREKEKPRTEPRTVAIIHWQRCDAILMPFQWHFVLVLLSFDRFHLHIKAYDIDVEHGWAIYQGTHNCHLFRHAYWPSHSRAPWFCSKLARTPKRFEEKNIWKLKIKHYDWWSLGWTSKLAMASLLHCSEDFRRLIDHWHCRALLRKAGDTSGWAATWRQ